MGINTTVRLSSPISTHNNTVGILIHTHCKKQSSHKEELVGNSQKMSKLKDI